MVLKFKLKNSQQPTTIKRIMFSELLFKINCCYEVVLKLFELKLKLLSLDTKLNVNWTACL